MKRGCSVPVEERFWKKVNKQGPKLIDTPCWVWTGAINSWGCARFWIHGRTVVYASRFSYELANGKLPEGVKVLHECDNPACVNPKHLRSGTSTDNSQDMLLKDRAPMAKLTVDQVREIKRRLGDGASHKILAEKYGVSPFTIGNISRGKTWACVEAVDGGKHD